MGIRQLILGPPGTGKTTWLLNLVESYLARGVAPNKIAFLSFTKAGADEAINRASQRFGIDPNDFCYFRTIHSLCYMLLGMRESEVMKAHHWEDFGRQFGYEITTPTLEFPNSGSSEGDKLMRLYQLSRARVHSVAAEARLQRSSLQDWRVADFERRLKEFKSDLGVMDFYDFLDFQAQPLPVDVLIIDEAQDLSRQQWNLIEKFKTKAHDIYVAGDDDQAIFEWAGADVDHFLSIGADGSETNQWARLVLNRSWRLGATHHALAESISRRIQKRYAKAWEGSDKTHTISEPSIYRLADAIQEGEWLLLARTNAMLKDLIDIAKSCGRVYSINDKQSTDNPITRAIVDYTALSRGARITSEAFRRVSSMSGLTLHSPTDSGSSVAKTDCRAFDWRPWFEALRLPQQQIITHRALLKRGESLTAPGSVRIATIHTTKGMECENVALVCTPTKQQLTDAEKRVWYVGASRAKTNLCLVNPGANELFRRK